MEDLNASLERTVFTGDLEKSTVLQIALGVNVGNGDLAIAQGCVQPVADSHLYESLNCPEAGGQQNAEGQEAEQKSARSKASFH